MACSPELPACKDGDGDDVFQHPALRRAGMSHSEFSISLPASDADRLHPISGRAKAKAWMEWHPKSPAFCPIPDFEIP